MYVDPAPKFDPTWMRVLGFFFMSCRCIPKAGAQRQPKECIVRQTQPGLHARRNSTVQPEQAAGKAELPFARPLEGERPETRQIGGDDNA